MAWGSFSYNVIKILAILRYTVSPFHNAITALRLKKKFLYNGLKKFKMNSPVVFSVFTVCSKVVRRVEKCLDNCQIR